MVCTQFCWSVLMLLFIVAKEAGLPRLCSPSQLFEALGSVLILSFLGCPCPYQDLFGVQVFGNISGNRTWQTGDASSCWGHRKQSFVALLIPLLFIPCHWLEWHLARWMSLPRIPEQPVLGPAGSGSWSYLPLAHLSPYRDSLVSSDTN